MRLEAEKIFVVACCTIISININKYSKVNCILNITYNCTLYFHG